MQGSHGMAGIQGSTAASKEHGSTRCCAELSWAGAVPWGPRCPLCSPPACEQNYHGLCPACSHTWAQASQGAEFGWGSSFQVSQGWAMRLPTSPSTYSTAWCVPMVIPLLCRAPGVCQGLPSEAVSSPSFAGSPGMFLSSTESTQAVRTSRRPAVQYFIQEEIYTHLSLAGGAASPGHSFEGTATPVFVQRKEPRFRGSVPDPEPGV